MTGITPRKCALTISARDSLGFGVLSTGTQHLNRTMVRVIPAIWGGTMLSVPGAKSCAASSLCRQGACFGSHIHACQRVSAGIRTWRLLIRPLVAVLCSISGTTISSVQATVCCTAGGCSLIRMGPGWTHIHTRFCIDVHTRRDKGVVPAAVGLVFQWRICSLLSVCAWQSMLRCSSLYHSQSISSTKMKGLHCA